MSSKEPLWATHKPSPCSHPTPVYPVGQIQVNLPFAFRTAEPCAQNRAVYTAKSVTSVEDKSKERK